MRKIVLINSFGPMGSSTLAANLEPFGFSNLPIRKYDLEKFLSDPSKQNKWALHKKIKEIIFKIQRSSSGGTSVFDRSFNKNKPKINYKKFQTLQKKNNNNGMQYYFQMKLNLQKSVCYKKATAFHNHIELPIDLFNRNRKNLESKILKNRNHILINCDRDPTGWLNSTLHQNISKNFFNVFKFPVVGILRLKNYKTKIGSGICIKFDDVFNGMFYKKLKRRLNLKNTIQKTKKLDCYGKLVPFEFANTKEEDNLSLIPSKISEKIDLFFKKPTKVSFCIMLLYYYLNLPFILIKIFESQQKKIVLREAKEAFLRVQTNKSLNRICEKFGSLKFYQYCLFLSACQKRSKLNFQHGLRIFDELLRRAHQNCRKVNILETGTARGFSALCLQEALIQSGKKGTIISVDKIGHDQKNIWKGVPYFFARVSRREILKPFSTKNINFLQATLPSEIHKIPQKRFHFVFLDAEHSRESVSCEIACIKKYQRKNDIIFFDDVNAIKYPGVFAAIKNLYGYKIKKIKGWDKRDYVVATKL